MTDSHYFRKESGRFESHLRGKGKMMRKRNQAELDAAVADVTRLEIGAIRLHAQLREAGQVLSDYVDLMRLLLQATSLKPRPGVYFLLSATGDLLYVGQSDNVLTRMGGHGGKKFHDARMIHVPLPAERDRLEQAFIHVFVPPLNVQLQAYNRGMALRALRQAEQKALEEKSMIVEGRVGA